MKKKLIVIDGNSLLYRMFYGVREMRTAKGIPTNAIYGFVNVLYKIQHEYRPDYFAITWDLRTPTFRHEIDAMYKDGRDKMPEDLQIQSDLLMELLDKMNIKNLTFEGYEADDIIGTLSAMGKAQGMHTDIITGDKDTFQLVDEDVKVMYTATRSGSQFVTVDNSYIQERYGVSPLALIEVKALMGDKSDNIPGVTGIGIKTAIKLVQDYGTVENLYAHIDEQKGKRKENLVNEKEAAFTSKTLGTIVRDVPLSEDFSQLIKEEFFSDAAMDMLKDLEMHSIIKRVLDARGEDPEKVVVKRVADYQFLKKHQGLIPLLTDINRTKEVTIHYKREPGFDCLVVLANHLYYYMDTPEMIGDFITGLTEIPEADNVSVIGHNLKRLEHLFEDYNGVIVTYGFDTYVGAYLLNPSENRLDITALAARYLDRSLTDEEIFLGKGKSRKQLRDVAPKELAAYMVEECHAVDDLKMVIRKKLKESDLEPLYEDIELPLVKVLASMEKLGIAIDVPQLKTISQSFETKQKKLEEEIYELTEHADFNINSPKQLGTILFEKLGLPVIKKTKTGYSTSAEVLEQLLLFHPVVPKILEYREVVKLDSTYGKGLLRLVDSDTHRIYSTFQQTVAATGRLSSTDPNLQNIPIKTEMGRQLRKVFVPSDDEHLFISADYSQIELRVLAHLSGDETLIEAFENEEDIHRRTASEIFDVAMEDVTPRQRGQAKAINFGLIYGKQAFSLGKDLDISRNEAQNYIDLYFERYPKVEKYMVDIVELAKKQGYVTTLFGRRRYIEEINSRNRMMVQAGERMALNTPIQGTAADIIKIAMIKVYNRLIKEGLSARILLQIHDELLIEAPESEQETVLQLLVEEMETAVRLDVPLTVDANTGHSWYEL